MKNNRKSTDWVGNAVKILNKGKLGRELIEKYPGLAVDDLEKIALFIINEAYIPKRLTNRIRQLVLAWIDGNQPKPHFSLAAKLIAKLE